MMSINVCFSTSNAWISRLIRWFDKSDVSHALITFYDETFDQVFVLEANGRGYMPIPWAKWRQTHTLVRRYDLDIPLAQQQAALREMGNLLGAEYDRIGLIGHLWLKIKRRAKNPFDTPTKLICSEAVARFLYMTHNVNLEIFKNYTTFTPRMIDEQARGMGIFVLAEDANDRLPTIPAKRLGG